MSKHSKERLRESEIPAAEFKAKCLSLMEDVRAHRHSYTVTKRGQPVARLVPIDAETSAFVGSLRGLVLRTAELTEPTEETWDAELGPA